MQPHSNTEQINRVIAEVRAQSRLYITTPDARGILARYQEPDRHPYLLQFTHGANVNTRGLMLDALELAEEMFQSTPEEHVELLYAIAFIAMRCALTPTIGSNE